MAQGDRAKDGGKDSDLQPQGEGGVFEICEDEAKEPGDGGEGKETDVTVYPTEYRTIGGSAGRD